MGNCCFRPIQETGGDETVVAGSQSRSTTAAASGAVVGNKLIFTKPPAWASEAPITRGQLLSKRDDFWDTSPSYGGKPEIWQALRAAAETEDVATAQAIMDAVNVTLPAGNLTLVYDELGNKYEIPPYCLSEPSNLVDETSRAGPLPAADSPQASGGGDDDGAGTCAPQIAVRLRLSTTGEDVEWSGPPTATTADLKAFLQEHRGLGRERLRCFFGGRLLVDAQTLEAGRVPNDVVLIVAVAAPETRPC